MKENQPFELDKKYELTLNTDYLLLPAATIRKILGALMIAHFEIFDISKPFPFREMACNIDWKWKSDRGSLPKRINKWYHDKYKITVPEKYLSTIGNVVREALLKNQSYVFDFTRKFNWYAGDFGDQGSCFWESRSYIKDQMMADPRMHAIRFFNPIKKDSLEKSRYRARKKFYEDEDTVYQGQSRAWFSREKVPFKVGDQLIEKDVDIVFNGYGMTTQQIASIYASYLGGASIKKIECFNNSSAVGGLYTNEGGFVVGDYSLIETIESYDFGLVERKPLEDFVLTLANPEKPNLKLPPTKGTFYFGHDETKATVDEHGQAHIVSKGLELKKEKVKVRVLNGDPIPADNLVPHGQGFIDAMDEMFAAIPHP